MFSWGRWMRNLRPFLSTICNSLCFVIFFFNRKRCPEVNTIAYCSLLTAVTISFIMTYSHVRGHLATGLPARQRDAWRTQFHIWKGSVQTVLSSVTTRDIMYWILSPSVVPGAVKDFPHLIVKEDSGFQTRPAFSSRPGFRYFCFPFLIYFALLC